MNDDLLQKLSLKKTQLDSYKPFPKALVDNLSDWFKVELTYTSNAIEGNTLSRLETALVIEKGITAEGKPLKDHLEATNHAQALDFLKTLTSKKSLDINQSNILEIHRLVLQKVDDHNAGKYRTVAVRIQGSGVILPNAAKVPPLMDEFVTWFQSTGYLHPATLAAQAHFKLVSIHPFVDGNGRTARLLMNLILMQSGYPPAIIKLEQRKQYLQSLEKAQLTRDFGDYDQFIYQAVDASLDVYLASLKQSI